ncbi:hypothetical protein KOW79_018118 [Hemibagrus wyckioides]|uniref:Uncharacterized protein n=1 Tax=Hemibagrus wyckioides TaxID=337641 RepID=A0A9D3SG54_9TELE|nr:hypothetical protein KOW79_018118 [Hemibagrus wyckioides]
MIMGSRAGVAPPLTCASQLRALSLRVDGRPGQHVSRAAWDENLYVCPPGHFYWVPPQLSSSEQSARGLPEQGSTRNELSISGNFEPHAHRVDSLVKRRFAHRDRIRNVWKDIRREKARKYDHN